MVRGLAAERLDPLLFDLSYDFVGDLAETVPRPTDDGKVYTFRLREGVSWNSQL